ncbi:MAG: ribokinase [Clostridiales bacterium]|nr:ribokinase [Clostridiales bacterium]
MKQILVIGSLNMDCVIDVPAMPKAGETISGTGLALIPGGKGANQAYAVGKLGGRVGMIGAVGQDAHGEALLENLRSVGVDVSGVGVIKGVPTGQAYITVDANGENSIIILAGTNGRVDRGMIDRNLSLLEACDIVILQLEIPVDTVEYVKNLAVNMGKTVILDPAPAVAGLPDSFWQGVDYAKPNETELAILTGKEIQTREDLLAGARVMLEKGVKNVLVSLGGKGCLLVTGEREAFFAANRVKAVDTTAAGDCFTAAFGLALSQGRSVEEAIGFGQKASAIAVTRKGAQTSIPAMREVEEFCPLSGEEEN